MMQKFKIVMSLIRSKAYVVLTETQAIVMIPLVDLSKFDNILMLSAQTSALVEFEEKLKALIKEHGQALENLSKLKEVR